MAINFNWLFGKNSAFAKFFGYGNKPAPQPTPTPTPTPAPTPEGPAWAVAFIVTGRFGKGVQGATVDLSGVGSGTTNGDGYVLFNVVRDRNASVSIKATGYKDLSKAITLQGSNENVPVTLEAIAAPAPKFTRAQLMDMQGDLMIWAPDIPKPSRIRGGARGLDSGWHWTLSLPFYPAVDRQRLYDKIKGYDFTHVGIQGTKMTVNGGYHDLYPVADANDADQLDQTSALVHDELLANGLIPVVAGVAPGPVEQGGAEVNPHLDVTKVLVAMSDWDNTTYAAERIKTISDTFPNALLYYERLAMDPNAPRAGNIDKSPHNPVDADWDITKGGTWIANMQRLCPRFVGVLYEVNNWPGGSTIDQCAAELNLAHTFWRDVQQVRFETNTYDKFWNGASKESYDALDAQLQAKCPQLQGFLSGGATHPPVQETSGGGETPGGNVGDMIPIGDITFVGGPDISTWAATAKITRLELRATDVYVEFTKQDGPGSWPETPNLEASGGMGPLQFSMGLAYKVNGRWFASAPIEVWRGKRESGGPIQTQNIGDGRGQIMGNWFYSSRWSPLDQRNPSPGEEIGFFVAAGDCRNNISVVMERSNIVKFALPQPGTTATFTWLA